LLCQASDADRVHLYWRYQDDLGFHRIAMEHAPHEDTSDGGRFRATLPVPERAIVYYLVAENEHKAMAFPRRASAAPLVWPKP